MYFTIRQREKEVFLDYKNKKLEIFPKGLVKNMKVKKSKNRDFPQGLVHGFGQKVAIFLRFLFQVKQARKMCITIFQKEKTLLQSIRTLILGNIGQENVFQDILERKNASRDYIRKGSRSRKIGIFPKGLVHCFGQKLAIFPCFYFRQNGPRKFVL